MRVVVFAVLALTITPALAQQQQCAPRTKIVEALSGRHKESRTGIGVTSQGAVLEIFSSPEGTWTILETTPDGTSCMRAAGEGWETVPYEAPKIGQGT